MANLEIDFARSDEDVGHVESLFLEYLKFIEETLGESLCFQDTEREFKDLRAMYDDLFLAKLDGTPVAACGLKRFSKTECELKRLYCRPAGRGHRLGQTLTERCIEEGRKQGYSRMLLDTNRDLVAANAIYEKLGFTDIEKYYDNPLGCSRYMALDL